MGIFASLEIIFCYILTTFFHLKHTLKILKVDPRTQSRNFLLSKNLSLTKNLDRTRTLQPIFDLQLDTDVGYRYQFIFGNNIKH